MVMRVTTSTPPVVQLTGEGSAAYVYFQRGVPVAKTVTKSTWPVINIDLAADGSVVGIEAVGIPEFTLNFIAERAGVQVPAEVARRARYFHAEQVPA